MSLDRVIFAVGLCASLTASRAVAAAPEAKHLFPAGAARGATVDVTVAGNFKPWPVKAWVSGEGVRFEPAKAAGKFSVVVDPKAAPGVRWVRFFNEEGASAPRPFVVGAVSEINEKEPNDELSQAADLAAAPVTINGALEKAGDVDAFRIALKRGQTLAATLGANAVLGSPVDAVLQLTDDAGHVLAQNHDDRGLDPRIVFHAPRDGAYVVRCFGFPADPNSTVRFAGAADYVYRLTLTHELPAEPSLNELAKLSVSLDVPTADEREPNDRERPQSVAPPIVVRGRIADAADRDVYRLQAKKGEGFHLRVVCRAFWSPLDPLLKIQKADGTELLRVDDVGRGDPDVDAVWRAPEDGEFRIVVEDLFGAGTARHEYLLDVRPIGDDFALTAAAGEFTVAVGKPLEIPVTVVRPAGMTGDVAIRIEGLPKEFGEATAMSTAKGNTAKQVTLKLTPKGPFSGVVRIVGELQSAPKSKRTAVAAVPGGKIDELWLTVKK